MAELIEKSAVLAMIDAFAEENRNHGFSGIDIFDIEMMKMRIEQIPAADVAQVVRCKDCKHFNRREHRCESNDVHCDLEGGAEYSIGFDVDDFCCFGERKEQDNG